MYIDDYTTQLLLLNILKKDIKNAPLTKIE